jgi:NAD(P)-dependent dehydrogenase (short-subunit alcohol dehydrogenase family)
MAGARGEDRVSVQQLMSLTGRRALITGGGRGLGRALAIGFAEAGAEIVVCARRESLVAETAAIINGAGGRADAITAEADVQRIREAAGAIDILVNNAASGHWHRSDPLRGHPQRRRSQVNVAAGHRRGRGTIRIVNAEEPAELRHPWRSGPGSGSWSSRGTSSGAPGWAVGRVSSMLEPSGCDVSTPE